MKKSTSISKNSNNNIAAQDILITRSNPSPYKIP